MTKKKSLKFDTKASAKLQKAKAKLDYQCEIVEVADKAKKMSKGDADVFYSDLIDSNIV